MRAADALTLFRTALVFVVAYLVLIHGNAIFTLVIIAVMFILDALDGYFARMDLKSGLGKSVYGPRLDVGADRVIEYVFWILYTYLGLLPIWIIFIIVIRHSFVDALMANKGTSSKLKTKFAQLVYGSDIGRGGINVVKAVTFAYLAMVVLAGWPLYIGLILTTILVVYILLRGAAEVYESYR